MMSVEQCSRRFDFVRLHRWAWARRLIRKPRSMAAEQIDDHLLNLMSALARGLLKEYGLVFKLHKEYESLRVEVPGMGVWLDEVKAKIDFTLPLELIFVTQEQPCIYLACRAGQISCGAETFEKLERELELLSNLHEELARTPLPEQRQIEAETPFGQVVPKRRRKRAA